MNDASPPVTGHHVAMLAAFLARDDAHDRLIEQSDPQEEDPGFAVLFAAAFYLAVQRRFGSHRPPGDIIRFVGSARVRLGRRADEVDPRAAEQLIHTVLTDPAAVAALDEATKETQVPLLRELVADEQFDSEGLDAFLAEACGLAEQMTT